MLLRCIEVDYISIAGGFLVVAVLLRDFFNITGGHQAQPAQPRSGHSTRSVGLASRHRTHMLDHSTHPHIVEAIAEAAASDHESALAIRALSRRFRDMADATLAQHLLFTRLGPDQPLALVFDVTGRMRIMPPPPPLRVLTGRMRIMPPPPPLRVLSATGDRLPQLYPPCSSHSAALKTLLEHARILDFRTSPIPSDLAPLGLRALRADTMRILGGDGAASRVKATCRRLVTMDIIGVRCREASNTLAPTWSERVVVNVLLPNIIGALHPLDVHTSHHSGTGEMVFLLRPIGYRVISCYSPEDPRDKTDKALGHDPGSLSTVVYTILFNKLSKHTVVGLEDVSWAHLGGGAGSKEAWLRAALVEANKRNMEGFKMYSVAWSQEQLRDAMARAAARDMDDLLSGIEFISHDEYRARVSKSDYALELLPLDGLLDQFEDLVAEEGSEGTSSVLHR